VSTSEYSNPPSSEKPVAVDPEAVQRAKREIQGLVKEISDLSRSDVSPEDFYDGLLNKVVAALAAPCGAVWIIAESGILQLAYQINLRGTGLAEDSIGQAQHGRLLQQVLLGKEGALVAPHSGPGGDAVEENAAANPTDFLLVMAPISNDQGPQGVVEVFQRPGSRPATQRGYLNFLIQVCELAGDFLKSRRLHHLADKQSLWEKLETFTRTVHETLNVRQTAYTIANEGRRLVGSDRVSVAIQRGGRCPIEAVSGQDVFDKRSNISSLLSKLAAAVTKTGEDVWYTGDTSNFAPQVEKALDVYVDESHTKAMAILPLAEPQDEDDQRENKKPPEIIGALIVEQMVDSRTPDGFSQRVEVVRSHSAVALANSLEHENLFLMPVWRTLGKATKLFRGRTLPKTLAVIGLVIGLLAAAIFVPADFKLEGDARLRPKVRQYVFAQIDGEIERVFAEHNLNVKKGDILAEQRSIDLENEIAKLEGDISEAAAQVSGTHTELRNDKGLSPDERAQRETRLNELRIRQKNLQDQLKLRSVQQEMLKIRSPIDGQVITWKVEEQLLGRPVTRGQNLMEVADPSGDWELEMYMPESRMGNVAAAAAKSKEPLKVTFIPATHTSEQLTGEVVEIHNSADVHGEEGNTVKIRVAFDQKAFRETVDDPKVGAEAIAKIHCGRRSIGYVWLHDLIDFVYAKILFRIW
jgi:hypothetical protein